MGGNKKIHFRGLSSILHCVLVPLFAFVFVLLYNPLGIRESLSMEKSSFTFNITILLCILFVSVSISRAVMYLLRNKMTCNILVYSVWCMAETVVAALFISLYMSLMMNGAVPFFEIALTSIGKLLSISIYPYVTIYLGMEIYAKDREEAPLDNASLIRFHDEYQKLRLVIAPEAVLFIKSEENYVQIHYTDGNRVKKHVLRSSMRALEENLTRHGLVRCHRSYFINPKHIKMIHKDSSGTVLAELNQNGYEGIPISRKYHEELTRLI